MQKAVSVAAKRKRAQRVRARSGKLDMRARYALEEAKRNGGCATFWRKANTTVLADGEQVDGVLTKQTLVEVEGKPGAFNLVRLDIVQCPSWLDRYYTGTAKRKAVLNVEEYDAGLELYKAFKFKIYGIKWSQDQATKERGGNGSKDDCIASLQYSERILRDFHGSDLSFEQKRSIERVCFMDEAAGDTYRLQTLKRGLARMAEIWRRGRPVCDANQKDAMSRKRGEYERAKISA